MSPDEIEAIKKLRKNFKAYAKHCLKIRPKDGNGSEPFILSKSQQRLSDVIDHQMATDGYVRVIVLKARQVGFSTFTSGKIYHYMTQSVSKKALIAANKADITRALFDVYKRFHANMPNHKHLKPSTAYSSRKELVFDQLDSSIQVATAGGDSLGRGETIQVAHLSEVAFWPNDVARDNWNAISQSIPNSPGSMIIIESTANGMAGNLFYEIWKNAGDVPGQPGTNGFVRFFSPWFEDDIYREKVSESFERTYEEQDLVDLYGLDDEQLQFRRTKIAGNGKEKFEQEYPSNAVEAFKASGRSVFNPDQIEKMLQNVKPPLKRMAVEDGSVYEHPRGELLVYHEKDRNEVYTIGADIAAGQSDKESDFSVAQILDSKRRQVAVWRGQVDPDYFATILKTLGYYYNKALIAPENNNHGILTCVRLGRDMHYPRIYTDKTEGKLTDEHSINIGFRTTQKTKPLIIDRLRATLRDNQIEINDKTTLEEMLSYIINESGSMEAEARCFDDCVISLAIANHCLEGKFEPVEMPDDLYVDAL